MSHTSLLQAIQKYISLSPEEASLIQTLFRIKRLKKGDFLLQAGVTCKHLYFIDTGLVRYFLDNKGEEITYNFAREGQFVCDFISFLGKSPSEKSIQCLEPTTLLVISYPDLQQFYAKIKEGEKFGRLCIESFYTSSILQVKSLYADQPGKRYLNFLEAHSDIQQRIPQYYIASYVGVKPQSLSRIRKRFANTIETNPIY
ncbi:MAG: Crp/Fnr family transcriptional regulator [Bacteroidetes bacterium]|nr:Crp/Fnr family transcriptional regulator [Bacteroidota bacterium]